MVAAGLVGLEVYLRVAKFQHQFFIHIPGQTSFSRNTWKIDLSGTANFTVNSQGLRGRSRPWNSEYDILTLGSSSTMGWMLDDSETWPEILTETLSTAWDGKKIWVGNGAKPGNRFKESHTQLKYLFAEGLKPNLIIVTGGGSELVERFYMGTYYNPAQIQKADPLLNINSQAFTVQNGPFGWRNLALTHLFEIKKNNLIRQTIPPENFFEISRIQRFKSKKLQAIPVLDKVQTEIKMFQRKIHDLAKKHNTRLIFVTRPTLWKQHMTTKEEQLLWFGHAGNNRNSFPSLDAKHELYYSSKVLYESMKWYNQIIITNCKANGYECYDVAAEVTKSKHHFFDDAHLTPAGSDKVARLIAKYIQSHSPKSSK